MKARTVNLKHESYDVYIGRPGKGKSGYFGNPIRIGQPCSHCGKTHQSGGSTLPCYTEYFVDRIMFDSNFKQTVLAALPGKRLGCFCKPNPCHGDILQAYVNWANNPDSPYKTEQGFLLELLNRVQQFVE